MLDEVKDIKRFLILSTGDEEIKNFSKLESACPNHTCVDPFFMINFFKMEFLPFKMLS